MVRAGEPVRRTRAGRLRRLRRTADPLAPRRPAPSWDVRRRYSRSGVQDSALRTLIALGNSVLEEPELELVFERVIDAGRELTGARYAALGVLDAAANGSSAS